MNKSKVQIAIFGAGIAGLWLHHTLRSNGYNAVLLTKDTIGGAQSLASQGMIHGGQRYTLQGVLNEHSESISAMPAVWEEALAGKTAPDLSSVQMLSSSQYLFSSGGLGSNVTAFFASKAMNSRVSALNSAQWPEIFKIAPKFKGSIYEMNEVVLDIKSLSQALATPYMDTIYKAETISYETGDKLSAVYLQDGDRSLELQADLFIFTAATGNEEIAGKFSLSEKVTQRRPLKQIMLKEMEYPLYAHCITTDPRPRLTISAHPYNNNFVWYLGGLVATTGITKSDREAISFAKKELTELFPWINWDQKEWSTYYVDRAEPFASSGFLPDGPAIREISNTILAWPTKLTFAPALTQKIINCINSRNIAPLHNISDNLNLPKPVTGLYPWDNCTWQKI